MSYPYVSRPKTAAKILDISESQLRKISKKSDFPNQVEIHGIKCWKTDDIKAWVDRYFDNQHESDTLAPDIDEFDKGVINLAEKTNGTITNARLRGRSKK